MCYREAIPAVSCLKCNIPTLPYWNFAVHSQWSDLTFHDQSFVFLTPALSQSGILFLLQSLSLYPANMLEFYWMNMKRSFLHHVHEVTVLRSLFFFGVEGTTWILMHRREMGEGRLGGKRWVKRHVAWMPQPSTQCLLPPLLYRTAASSRENKGVMAASPAPQLEK